MKKRILSLLLVLVLVLGMVPVSAFAVSRDTAKKQVRVSVENTTYPGGAWTDTLVDTWVDIDSGSTAMSCIVAALEEGGYTQSGAESGYIGDINGLTAGSAGGYDGWMILLNDWFISAGGDAFTVADGTLENGDEIKVVYSMDMGGDYGGTWANNDKSVKALSFSAGTLAPAFDPATHTYTLTVPAETVGVVVTPTAANKNFQVRTSVSGTEYKRSDTIPVADGTVITVTCGDPSWPSMNNGEYGGAENVAAEVYTITVNVEEAAKSVTIETGAVAEFMLDRHVSKIVMKGVEGTISGSDTSWAVELAEDTDMTQPITFEMTSSIFNAGLKSSCYFWVNDTVSTESVTTKDPGTVTVLPEWKNGKATVTLGIGTDSKQSGTTYTLELSVKGAVKEDPNTIELGESKSKKYFAKEFMISGATVSRSSISERNFSGSTSGHAATIDVELAQMPEGTFDLTMKMVTSGSVYVSVNGGSRENFDGTYTKEIDLAEGTSYTFVTYSTKSNSTVRGTYTISFYVAGMDMNMAPALKDSAVSGEKASMYVGQAYTLDLAPLFTDANGDALTYTVQIGEDAPVPADAKYELPLDKTGDYTLIFRASDGKKTSEDCYTTQLQVLDNTAPYLTGEASGSDSTKQYAVWAIDLSKIFADDENNGVTYTVSVNGAAAVNTAASYSYTLNESGTQTFLFQAKDDAGLTSPEYIFTLTVEPVSRTEIQTGCTGSGTGDTWLKSITVTGAKVESYEWNVSSGHTESDEHVLSIQLDGDTPDNAVIDLVYVAGYAASGFKGSISGPASVTLAEGKDSVKVTTSGWMGKGIVRTYILEFTNKTNSAPTAAASSTASVTVGETFTIDLSQVFTDPDGDELIYTVTADGKTADTGSVFSQTIAASGEHVFVFTAKDPWKETVTHTVTVTAAHDQTTYDVTVYVPEGIIPSFYITGGFDAEQGDSYGDALTATAGTAADGFVSYTVKVPESTSRISFRGADAEGISWGGMTAAVSAGMEPVTLVQLSGVIPSRVNGSYVTAQQAVFQLKDKDGCYAVSGSTGTDSYGIVNYHFLVVAWGTDDLSNAYTAYVVPQGDLTSKYVTTIGANKTFVKEQPQQTTQLDMTLKSSFSVTAPTGATVQVFQQRNYYNSPEITATDTKDNGDGTATWLFEKGNSSYMSYRVSMEGKITKAGYVTGDSLTVTWDENDAAPDCRTPYDTSTLYGSRGDDSIVLNVNGQNNLVMSAGGTFRLRGYRIWEIINSDTNNIMIQPDMTYSLSGDDILTVTPVTSGNGNGKNNWLDLKANGTGVAYLEVSYDALNIVTGNMSGFGGDQIAGFTFNACDPARTGLVVVQVGNAATDVSFGIQGTSMLNNASVPWDAEFDTLYFTGESGQLTLSPSVASGSIRKVEVSGDKGATWTELTAANGAYTAEIVSGNNVIRVTKNDGTEAYQVVRGDKITVTVTEKTGDGDNVPEAGETVRVKLNGVHNPIGKMSGNYNPGYGAGQHVTYSYHGDTVTTSYTYQYDFVSNAWVDVVIPDTANTGETFKLTAGYISFNVIGIGDFTDDSANHRGIGDGGCGTRGAGGTTHQRSILPELTLTVRDSNGEVKAVVDKITAIGEVTLEDETAITAAREAYDALTDTQKEAVTNYSDLQAAEKALAQLQSDAADQAAAAEVEALIGAIGEVTLDDEAAVTAARQAYDALSDIQKKLVDPTLVEALVTAEDTLVVLKDQTATEAVDALIRQIGEVTLEKETEIQTARNAYNKLTKVQRTLVTQLTVLEDAEKKLAELKNAGDEDYGLDPDEIIGYVTISFEDYGVRVAGEDIDAAYANPRGVIVPATEVPFKAYDTIASVTLRLLEAEGIAAAYQGSAFSGFYLSAIDGFGEFDAGSGSGWMITQNGVFINKGASEFAVKDGDVIRWQYTCQLGKDIGDEYNADTIEGVETLIDAIGAVTLNNAEDIAAARKAYNELTYTQKKRVSNYDTLVAAEEQLAKLQKAADEVAADKADELINAIGTVTEDSVKAIQAARKAYDALTAEQKQLVDNYKTLTDAEKAWAELKATQADKDAAREVEELIHAIGTVTLARKEKIEAARAAYNKLTDMQRALVENYGDLEKAEEALTKLQEAAVGEDAYKTTGDYLEQLGTPTVGSVGGEWMVIGLARSDREVSHGYYDNVIAYVQENIDENERVHSAKSTENSRMILALTAIGKNVADVDGHDLLAGLNDMAYIQKQGINGPIWALIAFDSGNYPTPDGDVTREALVQVILDAQLDDGGWTLSGEDADPDMTGMAIQALAPYYESDKTVKAAVDTALETLSQMQSVDGSFSSVDGANAESIAQVITALAALGIDADTDGRFIKNGVSAFDALLRYYVSGGGFRHIRSGGLDGMATEQGYYALAAYYRMRDGKIGLYNMTDVIDMGGHVKTPADSTEPSAETAAPSEPVEQLPTQTEGDKGGFPWWIIVVIMIAGIALVTVVIIKKRYTE